MVSPSPSPPPSPPQPGEQKQQYAFGDTVNGWVLGADNQWYRDYPDDTTFHLRQNLRRFLLAPAIAILAVAATATVAAFLTRQYFWSQNSIYAQSVGDVFTKNFAPCGNLQSSTGGNTFTISRNEKTITVTGTTCGSGTYSTNGTPQNTVTVTGVFYDGTPAWCINVNGNPAPAPTPVSDWWEKPQHLWEQFTRDERTWTFTQNGGPAVNKADTCP